MKTRKIGSLDVTVVGLGCNNFGWRINAADTALVVDAALDAGVNFLDTADVYGKGQSEEYLGAALKGRWNKVVLATKFGNKMDDQHQGAKPEYVKSALEDSLRRLGTDHVDLYQLHKPDPGTPIADTLGALDDLVQEGKVREIGCSNFSVEQLRSAESALHNGGARFVSVQNEYSMINREPEESVLPEAERLGVAFLPYFPLASGLLTGKYNPGKPFPKDSRAGDEWGPKVFTDENLKTAEALTGWAESRGHSLLELAFAWLLAHKPVASVIAGAKSAAQIRANAKTASWELSEKDMSEVNALLPKA